MNLRFRLYDRGWLPDSIEAPNGWIDLETGLSGVAMELAQTREPTAIARLRAILSAQATFAATCAGGFYAPNLTALTTPTDGLSTGFMGEDFKPESGLTYVDLDGYRFEGGRDAGFGRAYRLQRG